MTLKSDHIAAINEIYSTGAVDVTYSGSENASDPLYAIVDYDLTQYGEVAEVQGMTATVAVRRSDMTYPPRRGDSFTVDGNTYIVDSIIRADELEHVALVS